MNIYIYISSNNKINKLKKIKKNMKYKSKREIAIDFLKKTLIPIIKKNQDVSYNKILAYMLVDLGISNKLAKECIDGFINQGEISLEHDILTIPDKEIVSWLKEIKEKEIQIQKEFKEAGLV